MAQVLETFDFGASRFRSARYPWDKWFDGRIWKITMQDHGNKSADSFRSTVSSMAKRRGLTVRTAVVKDEQAVIIQQYNGQR